MDHLDQYEEHELTKVYDRAIVKRLISYMKPYKGSLILALALILAGEAARNSTPIVAKYAIDQFIKGVRLEGLDPAGVFLAMRWVLLLYFGLLAADLSCSFLRAYVTKIMGQRIMRDMRRQIFRHIHRLHNAFFDNTAVGKLLTRVMNDVAALDELFSEGLVDAIGSLAGLIFVVAAMLIVNWKLAIAALCVLPIIAVGTAVYQVLSRKVFREWRRQLSQLNAFMNERIGGLTTVQLFNQEKATNERFQNVNRGYLSAALRVVTAMAMFGPMVELAGGLATAAIIWHGGGQVLQNITTPGELYAFLIWGQRLFWPLRRLSAQYTTLLVAMASSERIFTLLDAEPEIQTPAEAAPVPAFQHAVEFKNVAFAYKEGVDVLKNVNLTIRKGERIAVVGATGSGKTTLINLMCRFYDIQQGEILFDGKDIRTLNLEDLRRRVGIVQQDVFLFSGSVKENIRLGSKEISDEEVERAAEVVQADRFICSLPGGYDAQVNEGGLSFSSGQKQLIAFARALAFNPDILILDEATSSIDTETEAHIQTGLKRLLEGRTSIIIAHRLSTTQDVDRIVVLHRGEIRETGTHSELMRQKGIYYRLTQLQYQDCHDWH